MTTETTLFAASLFAFLTWSACHFRSRAFRAEAKAQHWFLAYNDLATTMEQSASDRQWRATMAPALPCGTLANPVLTPNGDFATWGRLEDFTGEPS